MFRNMASIREKLEALSLPDLCNLGVWLRILLAVNGMAFIFAMQGLRKAAEVTEAVVEVAAYVEPTTLGSLMLACAIRRWLVRLPPWLHAGSGTQASVHRSRTGRQDRRDCDPAPGPRSECPRGRPDKAARSAE